MFNVHTINGLYASIEVEENDTIGDIKQKVFKVSNIPPWVQILYYFGIVRGDEFEMLLNSYQIHSYDITWAFYFPSSWKELKAINFNGHIKIISFHLKYNFLIEEVKYQIQDILGIPIENINIVYGDRILSDHESIINVK